MGIASRHRITGLWVRSLSETFSDRINLSYVSVPERKIMNLIARLTDADDSVSIVNIYIIIYLYVRHQRSFICSAAAAAVAVGFLNKYSFFHTSIFFIFNTFYTFCSLIPNKPGFGS